LRWPSRTAEHRPSEAVVPQDWWVVLEAMAHLCPPHRAVIFRSFYLGWTTSQIAIDMQTTEGVVHCRLHVALRALKAEIQSRDDPVPAG
jgi:RNA polymerase sigma-70 factor, ECF subfamily